MQAQPPGGQVIANHRHRQVAGTLAAVGFRQRIAQVAGTVGTAARLGEQRLPFRARQSLIVEIGTRPFAAVIEEALVVVLRLQRLDLGDDEVVQRVQVGLQFRRQGEIHLQDSPFWSATRRR
ncbi:hypothetical protein D3C76_1381930 [compost metagenome]